MRGAMVAMLGVLAVVPQAQAQRKVSFSQSATEIAAYDFVEVTAKVTDPIATNPFTDATVEAEFARQGDAPVRVDGFCDSPDGSVFRARFMPSKAGAYTYTVTYRDGAGEERHTGRFRAVDRGLKGIVRVDPEHPWHFIWEGTGEHYFYNGTTAYFLAGWDEGTIRSNLDRLARLKVTRVRSAISGRVANGQAWAENVYPTDRFSFLLNPWVAARPGSVEDPGFDVTRFNIDYWRKWDALLRHARDLDVVISVIFYVDGARPGVDPFGKERMGGEDEKRYYRYAAARFAAFSNVMWDLANEYRFFRDNEWAMSMGPFLRECDPYDHLTSVHGFGDFAFKTEPWVDFAMFQSWDEGGGYAFMRERRREQADTGRPMPQVNEEYGYEDHYPEWGGNRRPPARSADNRRRLAWGMYMAGCYQTAGERADTGTGWGPDTGGGWLNGRGDSSMVLFEGYRHIVDFFTSIPWWELEPDSSFIEVSDEGPARTSLTHIVYTRDGEGNAVLYVDGEPAAKGMVRGDVSNWDAEFRLALANELTRDRPWLGTYRRMAFYSRALTAQEVRAAFRGGPSQGPDDPLVLFDFSGEGTTVRDVSGKGPGLDLFIADPAKVSWLPGGGLVVREPTLIASAGPATKLVEAVKDTGCISVEAWISPASTDQTGPARIVTLSRDPGARNFTLGQDRTGYLMRFRATATSDNGEPPVATAGTSGAVPTAMGLRREEGDLAVVYLPAGGSVRIVAGTLKPGLSARWYNPRTGGWSDARAGADRTYSAPDGDDWALLLGAR